MEILTLFSNFTNITPQMVLMWAIGGLLMLAIGIVGEYIGKIYLETKGRPRYLIESVLDGTPESGDGRDPRIPRTENADPPAGNRRKGENDP